MGYVKKDINQSQLVVDLGNFRIGDQDSVRAAYRAMIEEEGTNLANLAEDIVENGLSPAESMMVMEHPDQKNHFVSIEGNRRITALRLLQTPALAADTPLHRRFVALAQKYAHRPILKVSCVVFDDKEEAFKWMERKHLRMDGRGLSQWGTDATARADAYRGKVRASKAVVDRLKSKGLLTATLEKNMAPRTNLDRVLQMPYMSQALGVGIAKDGNITYGNGDEAKGDKLLLKIVKAMSANGFNVNNIRSAEDRKDFLDGFADEAVLGVHAGSTAKKKTASAAAPNKPGKAGKPSVERLTLALKGRENILSVNESRLNVLYDEARRLNPDVLTNAGALLTRVFLELSTEHFLKKMKVEIPPKAIKSGRSNWSDFGITLKEKIACVLKELDPDEKNKDLKQARNGLSDKLAIHSIEQLHDFMHNLKADADPKEVKRIWERWHPYLALIFDTLLAHKK